MAYALVQASFADGLEAWADDEGWLFSRCDPSSGIDAVLCRPPEVLFVQHTVTGDSVNGAMWLQQVASCPVNMQVLRPETLDEFRMMVNPKPRGRRASNVRFRTALAVACREMDVPQKLVLERGRGTKAVTDARQLAMWMMREISGQSYLAIGQFFRRDHSTAMHSVVRLCKRREEDADFREMSDAALEAAREAL